MRAILFTLQFLLVSHLSHAMLVLDFVHNINTDKLTMTMSGSFDPNTVTPAGNALDTLYFEQTSASNRTFSNGSGTLTLNGQAPDAAIGGNINIPGGEHYLIMTFAANLSDSVTWAVAGTSFEWDSNETGQALPLTSTGAVYWGDDGNAIGPAVATYNLNTVPEPSTYAALVGALFLGLAFIRRKKA